MDLIPKVPWITQDNSMYISQILVWDPPFLIIGKIETSRVAGWYDENSEITTTGTNGLKYGLNYPKESLLII